MHTESMPITMDQMVDETQDWPEDDVAELVDRIYRVRYGDISRAMEVAWDKEIHLRIADFESGRVGGIPLEETLAKARAIADR